MCSGTQILRALRASDTFYIAKSIHGTAVQIVILLISDHARRDQTIEGIHHDMISNQILACHGSVLCLHRKLLRKSAVPGGDDAIP